MATPTTESLLTDMLNIMKRGGGFSSSASSFRQSSDSTQYYSSGFSKNFVRTTKDFTTSLSDTSMALARYRKAIKDSSASANSQAIAYKNLGKSVNRLFEQIPNEQSDRLTDMIIKASGSFHTTLVQGATSAQELGKIVELTSEALGNISSGLGVNLANTPLDPTHIKHYKQQMMVFEQLTAAEVKLKESTIKAAQKVSETTEKFKNASAAYSDAVKNGASPTDLLLLKDEQVKLRKILKKARQDLSAHTADLASATNESKNGLENMAKVGNKSAITNFALEQLSSATGGLIPRTLGVGAAFGVVIAGLNKMVDEFKKIAGAGLADSFTDIMSSSIVFGASQEAIIESMVKNRRDVMMLGSSKFTDNIGKASRSLRNLGLTGDDAWKAASAFHGVAVTAGVNVKDGLEYNKVMNKQIETFNILRAVTGITAEEFAAMNTEILSSVDNQKLMLRYSATERSQFLDKINKTREELVLMGLSAQAAQRMTNAMLGFEKSKFKDRFEAGAKLLQAANVVGVGGGQRAFAISRKNAKFRTSEENAFIAKFSGDLQAALQRFGTGGIGQEVLMDTLDDNMNAAAKGLLEAGTELKIASEAQRGVTLGQAQGEANKSTVSPTTAGFLAAADSINKVLGLGFTTLMGGLITLITLTAKNSGIGLLSTVKDFFWKAGPGKLIGNLLGLLGKGFLIFEAAKILFGFFSDFNEIFSGGGLTKTIKKFFGSIFSAVLSSIPFIGTKASNWIRELSGLSTSVDDNTSATESNTSTVKQPTLPDQNQLMAVESFNANSALAGANYVNSSPVGGEAPKTATINNKTQENKEVEEKKVEQKTQTTSQPTKTIADVYEILSRILEETVEGNNISSTMSSKLNKNQFGGLINRNELVNGLKT